MKKNKEVGVLGLWHLGSVYSACLAKLGFNVTAWDFDLRVLENLKKGIPPIEEPGLTETIKEYLNRKLVFASKPQEAIQNKKYIFITFDVPIDDNDKINLTVVGKALSIINQHISPQTTIVISSQVPVGFSRRWLVKIKKKDPMINIIYFSENLRLGTAFDSFLKPDRIIIGSNNHKALDQFEKDFNLFKCPFIKIGLESAEMAKHALNTYLAMIISFSSEISDLCELQGCNMEEVVDALKTERRISPLAPLNPGLGFAGGTLGRDIQTLRNLALRKHYRPLLLNSIYQVNKNRLPFLLKKIKKSLPSLQGKNVGILGLTYKPNTNTLRRSMSLELANILKKEGAVISAFDPMVKEQIESFQYIDIKKTLPDFFQALDLIILMTQWPEFKQIDWTQVTKIMRKRYIVDTKNFFDKKIIEKNNLKYIGTGNP